MSATPAPHPSLGQFRPGTPWDMLGHFSFKRKGFSWLSFYTLSVERQGNPPAKTHVLVHHSGRKDLSVLPAVFFFPFLFFCHREPICPGLVYACTIWSALNPCGGV